MRHIEISVITNSDRYIFGCLQSLLSTWPDRPDMLSIHVIANPATPEIVSRLRLEFPMAQIWENQAQRGFAANHNMILEQASAPYLLLINDDIVFLPHALERMLHYLEAHKDVGMVGPRLLNPDGKLQPSTYSFPTLLRAMLDVGDIRPVLDGLPFFPWLVRQFYRRPGSSRMWAHDRTCDVDTFRGATMLVRREALDVVGLMDEVTLLYGEETEWCYRFWESGYRIVFLADAEIIHYGKQSASTLPHMMAEVIKGYLNIFEKHGPRLRYHLFRLFVALVWGARHAAQSLRSGQAAPHTREIVRSALDPRTVYAGRRRFYACERAESSLAHSSKGQV